MTKNFRPIVVPAYILLCIFLGGSTQGEIFNLILQLVGIAIIAWALIERPLRDLSGAEGRLLIVAVLALILFALQLVPLPPGIWTPLPGRTALVEGYRLLDRPLPWLPLSLTPYETMATALTLIPPIAVLAAMLMLRAYRSTWLVAAILLGTVAAVLLGALQVGSSDPVASPWYLYSQTNYGMATGFFANSNHMGALLLVSLTLLVGLIAYINRRSDKARLRSALPVLAAAGLLVIGVGVVLNGSLAVLLLALPVAAASAALVVPRRGPIYRVALIAGAVALVTLIGLYVSPLAEQLMVSNESSFASRQRIWTTTIEATGDHGLLGSGLGSFLDIFRTYQDPSTIPESITNHAHNDYLELVLEAGLPAMLLLLYVLGWWALRAAAIWRSPVSDPIAQAAVVATGALLLHSIVDFPLRMPALSAIMAACLALMAMPGGRQEGDVDDLWPTRHVKL